MQKKKKGTVKDSYIPFPLEITINQVIFIHIHHTGALKTWDWELLGSPVGKTWCFPCHGLGFNPWLGGKLRYRLPRGMAKKTTTKEKSHAL